MTNRVDPMVLRNGIECSQRTMGPLAPLMNGLYFFQHHVIGECFPEAKAANMLTPIIAVEADERKTMRGRYATVGPIGYSCWITLNPNAFKTAADMAETLVHELCHWVCDVSGWASGGHGRLWQAMMSECGIYASEGGDHLSYGGRWHDLHAFALALDLDSIIVS
jgi:hypothetical protein